MPTRRALLLAPALDAARGGASRRPPTGSDVPGVIGRESTAGGAAALAGLAAASASEPGAALSAGRGAALPFASYPNLRNAGDGLLVALLVAIVPA